MAKEDISFCITEEIHKLRTLSLDDSLSILLKLMNANRIVMSEEQLSMRDSISLQRLKIPCRGLMCNHILCFDYSVYLNHNKNRTLPSDYKCPICDKSCVSSKTYVDSVHHSLLQSPHIEDNVYLHTDGVLRFGPTRSFSKTSLVIDLEDISGSDKPMSKRVQSPPFRDLKELLLRGSPPRDVECVSLKDLCRVTLEDVLQLINSSNECDELLSEIPFVKTAGASMLLQLTSCRPYICSSFQGLQHSLQLVSGVGFHRATKVVDCLVGHLEASFSAVRVLSEELFSQFTRDACPPPPRVVISDDEVVNIEEKDSDALEHHIEHSCGLPPELYGTCGCVNYGQVIVSDKFGHEDVPLDDASKNDVQIVVDLTASPVCTAILATAPTRAADAHCAGDFLSTGKSTQSKRKHELVDSHDAPLITSKEKECDHPKHKSTQNVYVVKPRGATESSSRRGTLLHHQHVKSHSQSKAVNSDSLTSLFVDHFAED